MSGKVMGLPKDALNGSQLETLEHAVRFYLANRPADDHKFVGNGEMSKNRVADQLLNTLGQLGCDIQPDDYVNL